MEDGHARPAGAGGSSRVSANETGRVGPGRIVRRRTVGIERTIARKASELPLDKQQKVLAYVESLRSRTPGLGRRRSLCGLCADLNVTVTEQDIAEMRHEAWGALP
jgi:hypothetical protein